MPDHSEIRQILAELLEAEWWALEYRDGELPVSDEVKFAIGGVIREAKPKVILTHWRGSMHKDHTAAADNLPDALFYAALPAEFHLRATDEICTPRLLEALPRADPRH